MNRFLFWFQSWKKVKIIEVTYSLITLSGNKIYEFQEEIKLIKPHIKRIGDFGYWEWNNEVKKEYIELLDKKSSQILNKFKEKERKKINQGWLDSGDYIVKCVWSFDMDPDWATYDEYKKYISGKEEVP